MTCAAKSALKSDISPRLSLEEPPLKVGMHLLFHKNQRPVRWMVLQIFRTWNLFIQLCAAKSALKADISPRLSLEEPPLKVSMHLLFHKNQWPVRWMILQIFWTWSLIIQLYPRFGPFHWSGPTNSIKYPAAIQSRND
jgi:hypothetical protein